jgi:hypothetical protein
MTNKKTLYKPIIIFILATILVSISAKKVFATFTATLYTTSNIKLNITTGNETYYQPGWQETKELFDYDNPYNNDLKPKNNYIQALTEIMLMDGTILDELIGSPNGDASEVPLISNLFCGSIQAFALPTTAENLNPGYDTITAKWNSALVENGWIPCDGRAIKATDWPELAKRLAKNYEETDPVTDPKTYNATFIFGESASKPQYKLGSGITSSSWIGEGTFNIPDYRALYLKGTSYSQPGTYTKFTTIQPDTLIKHNHEVLFTPHMHVKPEVGTGHTHTINTDNGNVATVYNYNVGTGTPLVKKESNGTSRIDTLDMSIEPEDTVGDNVTIASTSTGLTQTHIATTANTYQNDDIRTSTGDTEEYMCPKSAHVIFCIRGK